MASGGYPVGHDRRGYPVGHDRQSQFRVNVANQARLYVAGCELALRQVHELQQKSPLDDSFSSEFESTFALINSAINSIPSLVYCCDQVGASAVADKFQNTTVIIAGDGFDYTIPESKEIGNETLFEALTKKLAQMELVIIAIRDKYADAADMLESL